MPDPSRYDGRTPEPPYPTQEELFEAMHGTFDGACTWREDLDGNWTAECHKAKNEGPSFIFTDGGPRLNRFKFCPYCGHPIQSKR